MTNEELEQQSKRVNKARELESRLQALSQKKKRVASAYSIEISHFQNDGPKVKLDGTETDLSWDLIMSLFKDSKDRIVQLLDEQASKLIKEFEAL